MISIMCVDKTSPPVLSGVSFTIPMIDFTTHCVMVLVKFPRSINKLGILVQHSHDIIAVASGMCLGHLPSDQRVVLMGSGWISSLSKSIEKKTNS